MERDFWHKQTLSQPLFPKMEWSRPENRQLAGKLLVVGGHAHSFSAPAEAYASADKAGIGTARVLLPAALQPVVGKMFEAGEFAPSTPSGSFSQKALAELLLLGDWADGVLVAGDLGRNAETAILLEKFLGKSPAAATLTKDAVDYVTSAPQSVLNRPRTLLVLSLSQLQRLGIAAKTTQPITFSMDLLHLVDWLHEFTVQHPVYLVVKHLDTLFVGANGQVSTTKLEHELPTWRVRLAAYTSVWWLQNPGKPFDALTAAVASFQASL